jgi:hypothetical protein
MNAFLAQIDIGLIKSFFFNLLNFLDILFMLLYDEIDCYDAPKSGAIVDHYCRPYYILLIINLVTKRVCV